MKTLLYFLFILACTACTAPKKGLVLEGQIKGAGNDHLVIFKPNRMEQIVIDTVEVKQGKFKYENPNIETTTYGFELVNARMYFNTILEPVHMTINGDIANAQNNWLKVEVLGGRNVQFVKDFNVMRENLLKEPRFAAYADCQNRLRQSRDKEEADKIRAEMEPLEKAFNAELFPMEQDLIRKNIDVYAIQTIMTFRFGSYQKELVEICKQIPDSLRTSDIWPSIQKEIDSYEATRPGKMAPEFTLYTPDSTALSLSDLRGKYVLLDFWASWCAPCRASFPKLKELYKQYKPKGFEILSITNDNNHKQWKKAIEEDQTPWLHVADEFPAPPAFGTARVIDMYGFHYLPSTMLIDPEGKIIATLKGEQEIEEKLNEIFL